MSFTHCPVCGVPWDQHATACSNQLRSIVPARMPEESNAEALAVGPSVPGDSRREVEELLAAAEHENNNWTVPPSHSMHCLIQALRILNENR